MITKEEVSHSADALQTQLVELRRLLHRHPELSNKEVQTSAIIKSQLEPLGLELRTGLAVTGLMGLLRGGRDHKTIALRADMDGLPVEEKSGLENASRAKQTDPITGTEVFTMHACGHDVHITSLVGTARQMAARREQWSGKLMLLVQPAEERVLGAQMMKDDDFASKLRKRLAPFPHWYLAVLGVDPRFQGKGCASKLLKPMLARLDAENLPCYVETSTEKYVLIYQHFGFRVIHEAVLPGSGSKIWVMLRKSD